MRKILFSSLILLFATWALPSSAAAATCPAPADQIDIRYTAEGTGDTAVTECDYGLGNPIGEDEANTLGILGGGWTSYCDNDGQDGFACDSLLIDDDPDLNTWSFTGEEGFEYAILLKDGASVNANWAAFLLEDDDTSFEGTWLIETLNNENQWVSNDGRLSHFAILDRPLETTPTTTPDATTTTPDSTTPGPIVPEPTLLTLLGGGMLLAGRRLRRRK